jgi:hypothetical protein
MYITRNSARNTTLFRHRLLQALVLIFTLQFANVVFSGDLKINNVAPQADISKQRIGSSITGYQIGFAHRVNDWDVIGVALSHKANGIEMDICWGGGALRSEDWYVSHNDGYVCANPSAEHLHEWLNRLKTELNNNQTYKDRLVALWIDIKDISDDYSKLDKVVAAVHSAGLPNDLKIIYDLTGYNENSVKGFHKIRPLLNQNEGISMCAGMSCKGDLKTVKDIFDLYKNSFFTRGGFNTGDSFNIDERYLMEANKFKFIDSPYRFKFVHTWTNQRQSAIADYVNPANSHYTDGQIIGAVGAQYDWTMGNIIQNFYDVVGRFPSQRIATKSDPLFGTEQDSVKLGTLISKVGTNKCLDIRAYDVTNGNNTQLWDCHGEANQKWMFDSNGMIRSQSNLNKCLDPEGPSYANGTEVQVWDCIEGYAYHKWIRNPNGSISPFYARHQCIEVQPGRSGNGSRIQLGSCNGLDNQRWFYEGDFKLLKSNLDQNKCLDIPDASNGRDTHLWSCHGGANQKWFLDHTNKIRSLKNINKCLDPEGPSYANGTAIQVWDCLERYTPHQWVRSSNESIRPQYVQNQCIDIYGGNTSNGAKINLWTCHGGANQGWLFRD